MRTPRRRRLWGPLAAGALAALGFLALLAKDPLLCWNDDFAISILPTLADVARSWSEGAWPLLSPYSWGCANLAGEYQYGTFSVFVNAVVVAVFACHPSYPVATAALSAAHLFALAAGAFLLGRRRGLSDPLATLVALSAALNGWTICWGATDWFGALAAWTWLPWAWWAFETALDRSAPPCRWRWWLPAPFVYLLVAGGFPYTVLTLGALTVWLAAREWLETRRLALLAPLAAGWALGLGLAAPAWLSLLTYMTGSGRAVGEGMHHHAWVVPLRSLPGLILPCWVTDWPDFAERLGPHAAIELTGALFPLAAVAAAAAAPKGRLFRWDALLAAAVLVQCLLPSAGVFRWSFRSLPMFHLALGLAGAQALQRLDGRRWRQNPGLWAAGAVALAWAALPAARVGGGRASAAFELPLASLLLATGWMLAERAALPPRARDGLRVAVAFGLMMASYLFLPLNPGVPRYPFTENLARPEPLSTDRLYVSLYRAPDDFYHGKLKPAGFGAVLRPGSTGMFAGLRLINGYSPVHPAGVGRRIGLQTHGEIPPDRARELLGSPDLLDRLGVDGLIIARDYPPVAAPAGWAPVFASDEGVVYHRPGPPLGDVRASPAARVRVWQNERLRVAAEVTPGPGSTRVDFRRPFFPGYRATVNGRAAAVGSFEGLFPTVELPAGAAGPQTVILAYHPPAVLWGFALAGVSAAVLALIALRK